MPLRCKAPARSPAPRFRARCFPERAVPKPAKLNRIRAQLPERRRGEAHDGPKDPRETAHQGEAETQRPPLWKVILLNDDFTPREFVAGPQVRLSDEREFTRIRSDDGPPEGRLRDRGYTRDVAETKAKEATEMGRSKGYPLYFTTEKKSRRESIMSKTESASRPSRSG